MSAILKEDPPDLSQTNRTLSPALDRLVRHCLEKVPGQRFQSARDLAYDLENLSSVSGPDAGRALERGPRSRRALWVAAAAALVLATVAWLALRSVKAPAPASTGSSRPAGLRRGRVSRRTATPSCHRQSGSTAPASIFACPGRSRVEAARLPDERALSIS
jgi:hypothetical protein